jgi:hypothetical protein
VFAAPLGVEKYRRLMRPALIGHEPYREIITIDPFSLYSLLSNLFNGGGGGSQSSFVRQLLYRRHPLYVKILGVPVEIIITVASAAPVMENGAPSNTPPLQRVSDIDIPGVTAPYTGNNYCGPGNYSENDPTTETDACCQAHDNCYGNAGLQAFDALIHPFGLNESSAQASCDQALCNCVKRRAKDPKPISPSELQMMRNIWGYFCH